MNTCYLSMGSNQKNPERQIRLATKNLRMIPHTSIKGCSSLHWSKAWGLHQQQDFCNVVVEISTTLTPEYLLKWCQQIENKHKRVRKKNWGPRTLDIDIVLFGNRSYKSKNLTIPHPYYLSRSFVIQPLLEINNSIL